MLCAVIEACKQLAATDKVIEGFEFRDIIIGNALLIHLEDKGVPINLHIRPRKIGTKGTAASWLEFTLYSQAKDADHTEHCSGLIQIQYQSRDGKSPNNIEEIRDWNARREEYSGLQQLCTDIEGKTEFYSKWASRGMQYGQCSPSSILLGRHLFFSGPLFQPIDKIATSTGAACCELVITDTKSIMPAKFEYEHVIHPTTLDGIFQTFVAGARDCIQGMVPTAIASLYVSATIPSRPGSRLRGFSRATRKGFRNFVGPIYMSDETWMEPKVVVKGIFCTELGALSGQSDPDDQSTFVKKLCSQFVWKENVDQLNQDNAEAILSTSSIHIDVSSDDTVHAVTDLEKAAQIFITKALADLSLDDEATVAPHMAHYLQWMRHRKLLENDFALDSTSGQDLGLLDRLREQGIEGQLLALVGGNIGDIIKGTVAPGVLGHRLDLISEYQVHAHGLKKASQAVLRWLDLEAHKRPDNRYLEISANVPTLTPLILDILVSLFSQTIDSPFTRYKLHR